MMFPVVRLPRERMACSVRNGLLGVQSDTFERILQPGERLTREITTRSSGDEEAGWQSWIAGGWPYARSRTATSLPSGSRRSCRAKTVGGGQQPHFARALNTNRTGGANSRSGRSAGAKAGPPISPICSGSDLLVPLDDDRKSSSRYRAGRCGPHRARRMASARGTPLSPISGSCRLEASGRSRRVSAMASSIR